MSWDGVALGTQWAVEGMAIASPPTIVGSSMDANNTGWVEYLTYYDGGTFWLSKDGPWGDGYSDLIGDVENYSVTIRVTYVMGNHVARPATSTSPASSGPARRATAASSSSPSPTPWGT